MLRIKGILNEFVNNFGFIDFNDFQNSFIHKNLLVVTIPFALVVSFIEKLLGLEWASIVALSLLLIFELLTGVLAALNRGEKISSKKFPRFGLKAFTWFFFLYILNTFKFQYIESHFLAFEIFSWLHTSLIVYISTEYLISVDENISSLSGKKQSGFVTIIRKRFMKFFDISEKDKEAEKDE